MNKFITFNFGKVTVLAVLLFLFLNCFSVGFVSAEEGRPDLTIVDVDYPEEVDEGDTVEFKVLVKNIRNVDTDEYNNISAGTKIWVALKMDNAVVSTNYSNDGLNVDDQKYINLSWVATYKSDSSRKVEIEVDYLNDINENNENNNVKSGVILVTEKEPDIEITDVDIPEFLNFNETKRIYVSIINNGADTTKSINAWFNSSKDGEIENVTIDDVLERDDLVVISFNWTPDDLGRQSINISIEYDRKIHDYYVTSVFIGKLPWWNDSWHYRYFLTLTGTGNISKDFNFTELLEYLNVESMIFENETLRIVKYSFNGEIEEVVDVFYFNESSDFKNQTNARGTLSWDSTNEVDEKYYCIYFDVGANPGVRTGLPETEGIDVTGSASVSDDGFVEGWNAILNEPVDDSYFFSNDSVNFSVICSARAENITVFVFQSENQSNNDTLYLSKIGNGTEWIFNNYYFNGTGNWTITVYSWDKAGFNASVCEIQIYVGKPDLEIGKLSYETDWYPTSPDVYIDDRVDVSASIYCSKATLENVNVTFLVFDVKNKVEVKKINVNQTFLKNSYTNMSFGWIANLSGVFNVSVFADSDNIVDELNESNNFKNVTITVNQWPDLIIKSIKWPSRTLMEYEDVKFDIIVENVGLGNAKDYTIKLYIEPESQGIMEFENVVDSTNFSLNSGKSKTVSLYWNSSEGGIWYVGAKIFVYDNKKDSNNSNNNYFSLDFLTITPTEKNKPVISNVDLYPESQQQGGFVEISASVTDDTGLKSVKIYIWDPTGGLAAEENMIRTTGNLFKYIFKDTYEEGEYSFEIVAIDISINKNNDTYKGGFEISRDSTYPTISYVGAQPYIQLVDSNVTISCITYDNIGISSVEVFIIPPEGSPVTNDLTEKSENEYVYKDIYKTTGVYKYYVTVKDIAGNTEVSDDKFFYITKNINDKDNDGMPDWWEERYGFDSSDPSDAGEDFDKDGVTNLVEYKAGTNPQKDIFLQNVAYRVRSNILYILSSVILFFVILIIIRISKKWRG